MECPVGEYQIRIQHDHIVQRHASLASIIAICKQHRKFQSGLVILGDEVQMHWDKAVWERSNVPFSNAGWLHP